MVVEALLSTRYRDWVRVLCSIHPSEFPTNATFLVSSSDNPMSSNRFVFLRTRIEFKGFVSRYSLDFSLRYNIIARYLPFSELQKVEIGSEIPTYFLEPTSIHVTNNSESNYTLDGIRIVHPDLYLSGSVAVHGIESSLKPKSWSFLERFVTTFVFDLLLDLFCLFMLKWINGIGRRGADRRPHPHAD
ncbi:hypothetical protein MKX03_026045 [Papaver bracteatum]|nr:hypothetical protein MKX03_026045 [Papaver bracteatum]